jgi:hypothetical protein
MTTDLSKDDLPKDRAQRLIPGAYDRTTLTHRQPGAMGGGAFGSGIPAGPSSMDAATIAARELEGGGGVRGRAWWSGWWSPVR